MQENTTIDQLESNSRRNLLIGTTALAAALATGSVIAGQHKHHTMSNSNSKVIDTALDSVKKGEACISHCIKLIEQEDTSIANCLAPLSDMVPMCAALVKLATSQSRHLNEYAALCMKICKDCETECKKHADMHVECKDCLEACAACREACKELIA